MVRVVSLSYQVVGSNESLRICDLPQFIPFSDFTNVGAFGTESAFLVELLYKSSAIKYGKNGWSELIICIRSNGANELMPDHPATSHHLSILWHCCIEELKRNNITWFFSLNAPPHILSCAQIPRCSVIHSVLLICSLLCQDLADVHIFGNCTATWCLIFSGGNESVTSTKVTTARSICYLACLMMYPGCFVLVCDRFSLPGGVDSAGSPPVVALWRTGPLLPSCA